MKEIDEDILVSLVNEFLEPFEIDSDFASDFGYDAETETVYFSILINERSDRLFTEYIRKTFNFKVPNIFIMSLLHEVGHYFTWSNFSKKRIKNAHKIKKIIESELKELTTSHPDYDIVYSKYFDLQIEKVATAWAVNYYKNNKERCDTFYSKFEAELHKQYSKLNITEN